MVQWGMVNDSMGNGVIGKVLRIKRCTTMVNVLMCTVDVIPIHVPVFRQDVNIFTDCVIQLKVKAFHVMPHIMMNSLEANLQSGKL